MTQKRWRCSRECCWQRSGAAVQLEGLHSLLARLGLGAVVPSPNPAMASQSRGGGGFIPCCPYGLQPGWECQGQCSACLGGSCLGQQSASLLVFME